MESFAAFGFAGNVVQSVDYSVQVTVRCKEVYQTGTTLEVQEMSERVSRLQTLSEALQHTLNSSRTVTEEEQASLDIADKCIAAAKELQTVLAGLYKASNSRIITGLRRFWRALRRPDRIIKLADELMKLRDEMNTIILASLHVATRRFVQDQRSAHESLDGKSKHLLSRFANGIARLSNLTTYESERTQVTAAKEHGTTRHMLADGLRKLQANIDSYLTTERRKAFIESLAFPEVKLREQQIATPHTDTLRVDLSIAGWGHYSLVKLH